jgi:hypothetical protein
MATTALATYLNDHLGGAAVAVQLLERLIDKAGTPEDAKFFSTLRAEIEEDRSVLEALVHRLGDSPSGLREFGGWIAAKFTGLKLKIDDPGSGTLDRFEAIEAIALGIHGKSRLWRALGTVAAVIPELQTLDLKALERRADDQEARMEARRLDAARLALARTAPDSKPV